MKDSVTLPPGLTPLVVTVQQSAVMRGMSIAAVRNERLQDEKRLQDNQPIIGPPWFRDGERRIRYKVSDIVKHVERRPTFDQRQAG